MMRISLHLHLIQMKSLFSLMSVKRVTLVRSSTGEDETTPME